MNQFLEFVSTHWLLCSAFVVLLTLLIQYEITRGGQGVNCLEAVNLINHQEALVLDVRPSKDFKTGHITAALNIPHDRLSERLGELAAHKDKPILLVCLHGHTTGASGQVLRKAGFNKIYRLTGGIAAWQGDRLPLVV